MGNYTNVKEIRLMKRILDNKLLKKIWDKVIKNSKIAKGRYSKKLFIEYGMQLKLNE